MRKGNETVTAKRRCEGVFGSVEAVKIFSPGRIWRVVVVIFLEETS